MEQLFLDYIAVCNKALEANKDKFPFSQILAAAKIQPDFVPTHVRIIDDMVEPHFQLRLTNDHIECQKNCETCGGLCDQNAQKWQVKTSYLKHVIDHADDYIQNPAMLDWEWIKNDEPQS